MRRSLAIGWLLVGGLAATAGPPVKVATIEVAWWQVLSLRGDDITLDLISLEGFKKEASHGVIKQLSAPDPRGQRPIDRRAPEKSEEGRLPLQ